MKYFIPGKVLWGQEPSNIRHNGEFLIPRACPLGARRPIAWRLSERSGADSGRQRGSDNAI
jgi:hypothetical protein